MKLIKKIIRTLFRKQIAKAKAKYIAEKMIDSIKIGTKDNLNVKPINSGDLNHMKETGIKKVELICPQDCECCKNLKNKEIPIDEIVELPHKDCPLVHCYGSYGAVVEFDLS